MAITLIDSYRSSKYPFYNSQSVRVNTTDQYLIWGADYENSYGTHLLTIEIGADGQIAASATDSQKISGYMIGRKTFAVGDNYFAAYARGVSTYFDIKTVNVDNNGNIGSSFTDAVSNILSNKAAAVNGNNNIATIAVGSGIYLLGYRNQTDTQISISTISINSSGDIASSLTDTLNLQTYTGTVTSQSPTFVHISGDVYAVAFGGQDNDGFISTVSINSSGSITDSVIDSWEFETGSCLYPSIFSCGNNNFLLIYNDVDGKAYAKTVYIANDGTITESIIDSEALQETTGDSNWTCAFDYGNNIFTYTYIKADKTYVLGYLTVDSSGNITLGSTLAFGEAGDVGTYYVGLTTTHKLADNIIALTYAPTSETLANTANVFVKTFDLGISVASSNLKKFNSIAYANLKKINGVAIANVKKLNGIA